ncbi:20S proteasome alpha subunit 4 [Giardia muris]|uniref:Proteasome subunit alpha type n=1 Tax=Giardia muris TaxID=5742 RepID=A0A4Z1SSN1_GIAMU|nr:20S proteasome alpha subunit 4 [Giardia muris]|eukprot:TNJ26658.1 20S proteasome alpha subunit 4 [Giardia muris]
MGKYDSSLTVFSPEGHLIQVEHAHKAVERGTTAVAVRAPGGVVLAVERKQTARLQDPRSAQKIFAVDDHIIATFAGLTADARVLIDRARHECQAFRFTYDAPPSVEAVARAVASVLQSHTQRGGTRPFGVSVILAGHDSTGPHVFLCDPSGVHSEWKALAIGSQCATLLEFLEQKVAEAEPETVDDAIKLAKAALNEVVESTEDAIQYKILLCDHQ